MQTIYYHTLNRSHIQRTNNFMIIEVKNEDCDIPRKTFEISTRNGNLGENRYRLTMQEQDFVFSWIRGSLCFKDNAMLEALLAVDLFHSQMAAPQVSSVGRKQSVQRQETFCYLESPTELKCTDPPPWAKAFPAPQCTLCSLSSCLILQGVCTGCTLKPTHWIPPQAVGCFRGCFWGNLKVHYMPI